MNDKSPIKVIYGYIVKNDGSQKQFTARAIQNGKPLKTKTISIGRDRNEDEAYNLLVATADELAKTYKCSVIKQTKAQLLAGKAKKTATKTKPDVVAANPLVERFGNQLHFEALLRHAIKRHGIDKVDEVLKSAKIFVDGARAEVNREATVISSANRKIAQAVLDARKEGVEMQAPSNEIEDIIKILISNEKRKEVPQKIVGKFEKDGQKWDGKGNAPAAIAKYLNENEEHTLEDLRVS